jgi:hypothetical protein
VKAGHIDANVKKARSLRIRNSQILGNGKQIFDTYAGAIRFIEVDSVIFGGDLHSEPVTIAGGFSLKSADRISNVNESITITNSTIPSLDAAYLNTRQLVLKNSNLVRVDISNGRIADLEISGSNIGGKLNAQGTQAARQKVDLSAGTVFGRIDQLEGSNIKLPPRSER